MIMLDYYGESSIKCINSDANHAIMHNGRKNKAEGYFKHNRVFSDFVDILNHNRICLKKCLMITHTN